MISVMMVICLIVCVDSGLFGMSVVVSRNSVGVGIGSCVEMIVSVRL